MLRGLVLGKFYPLHSGHEYLITQAALKCDHLTILIGGSIGDSIPLELRQKWVAKRFPKADVRICWDEIPDNYRDPAVWDQHMKLFKGALAEDPDVIFTSENYGPELARRFKAAHVSIDCNREVRPASATQIREDPAKHWGMISLEARAYLAKRIVVVGSESTGTTTLAGDLAKMLMGGSEFFVPEYGRLYVEEERNEIPWDDEDFIKIAVRQQRLEDEYAEVGGPYLICDTNAWATRIWQERYMGGVHADVQWVADQCKPDLYVLTSEKGIPFEQDGTRDGGPVIRKWMNQEFREQLESTGVPWIEVQGNRTLRMMEAERAINYLKWRFSDPLTTERPTWASPSTAFTLSSREGLTSS